MSEIGASLLCGLRKCVAIKLLSTLPTAHLFGVGECVC